MPPLSARPAWTTVFLAAIAFALVLGVFGRTPAAAQVVPLGPSQPITGTPAATIPTSQPFGVPGTTPGPATPSSTPQAEGSTPIPSATPKAPTGRRLDTFLVKAKRIAFYSSRYIVGADGNVDVTLGDGTHITGNTFAMDLRLNRFLVAGNVGLTAGGRTQHGAAFAEYFDFDRAYFIPITSEPDRWTFVAGDYDHPLLGREMPGDVFFLPDLSGDRVFLDAKHATIDPKQSVRFTPASINFGLGAYIEFPSYFLNFSPNPNFAQNSLPGAYVDGPLDLFGGEHGLVTAHLRYDSANKVYPAIEAHQVSTNHYIVGSINPLTRPFKQYNLLTFDRISPGLQVQGDFQESAFQHAFSRPLSATAYAALQITGSLRQSFLQLSTQNYYESLLAMPAPYTDPSTGQVLYFYGDPTHNFVPDHPFNSTLNWIGYRQRATKYFRTQVRSGVFFANSATPGGPLITLGNTKFYQIAGGQFGIDVIVEPITLLKDEVKRPKVYLTAVLDKQRQYFTTPHYVDTQFETVSLTDILVPRKLSALLSYTNTNTGDFYGDKQTLAYPAQGATYYSPTTGQIVPGFAAFRGFATQRALAQQFVYTPTTDFTASLSLRENRDFPIPVAGPPTIVGPTTAFENFGNPPYQADLDVRYRLTPSLYIDVERSYYFGFGGYERFSPQFYVQLLK